MEKKLIKITQFHDKSHNCYIVQTSLIEFDNSIDSITKKETLEYAKFDSLIKAKKEVIKLINKYLKKYPNYEINVNLNS